MPLSLRWAISDMTVALEMVHVGPLNTQIGGIITPESQLAEIQTRIITV